MNITSRKIVISLTKETDAALKRADELREDFKKMRDRLQQITLLGCPVVVSDEIEKGTALVFCGFDDLGKPIATKIINVGTNTERHYQKDTISSRQEETKPSCFGAGFDKHREEIFGTPTTQMIDGVPVEVYE